MTLLLHPDFSPSTCRELWKLERLAKDPANPDGGEPLSLAEKFSALVKAAHHGLPPRALMRIRRIGLDPEVRQWLRVRRGVELGMLRLNGFPVTLEGKEVTA